MLRIVQDSREQTPFSFSENCAVTVAALAVGDYSLAGFEDQITIERKSLNDLLGSITHGRERFVKELRQLRAFRFAAIVVEASWDEIILKQYTPDVAPNAVVASLLSFALKYGVVPILAGDAGAEITEKIFHLFAQMVERDAKNLRADLAAELKPDGAMTVAVSVATAAGPVPGSRYARAGAMMPKRGGAI